MHRLTRSVSAATVLLILTLTTAVSAQPSVPDNKRGCSQPGNSEDLSSKLAQSGGVICPQNTDPAIKAPTPPTGDKPVIRPPAGGGDNPNVQSK